MADVTPSIESTETSTPVSVTSSDSTQPIKTDVIQTVKRRHKQDNSVSAWLCRMWFGVGLLILWPIAWMISRPVYFLHYYFGFDPKRSLLGKIFRRMTSWVIRSNPFWKIRVKFLAKDKLPKTEKK